MRRTSSVAFVVFFCVVICVPLLAQKFTGTITGVVTDTQGAVVASANVRITNKATAASRTATTDSNGVYVVPELAVGTYSVAIKAANFKEYIARDVELNTSSTATVNAVLEVGATTDQVTVEASTVQVETSTGAIGNVVEGNEVRELPLNGRNFIELTQLAPGVSPIAGFDVVKKGLEGGTDFSVNGNSVTSNLFLVDGVNNNDIGSNRTILIYPSLQAIDEFKILRNSYGPEYGQAAGAIVNIVTRGGTNQFHGGVFYDGRNDALNANSYFNNLNGARRPPLHRNDYGFNIGGPVIKDRLFFFESEEWNKEKRGIGRFAEVPTLAERMGDFSNLRPGVDANGNLCDPAPIVPGSVTPGNPNGTPFTAIPAGQISIGGQTIAMTYPLPNITGAPNCINWGENFSAPVPWREDNVRLDVKLTPTWSLMGRFTNDDWAQPFPSTLSYWGDDIYPSTEGSWKQPGRQATIKLTKLLGSTAVNDFQLSYAMNRISVAQSGSGVAANANPVTGTDLTPTELQLLTNVNSPPFFSPSSKFGGAQGLGQPLFWSSIDGTQNIQNGPAGIGDMGPWRNNQQLMILKDDFSKVFGAHTFKVGFIATNNQKNEEFDNSSGQNSQYWTTSSVDAAGNGNSTGNGIFDLLWNQSMWGGSENSTTVYSQMRWHDYEFYAGDNYKVRRNLTLEYGVRWSLLRNAFTGDDHYGNWQPSAYDPAIGGASPCNGELLLKPGIQLCNQLAASLGLASSGAVLGPNRSLKPQNDHMIAPRLGLAWDPKGNGKTSIRAGFGQFFLRDAVGPLEGGVEVAPFVTSVNFVRPLDTVPSGLIASGTPSRSTALDTRNPYTLQYNLTVERELFPNTKLELAYVGNGSRHLVAFSDVNPVPVSQQVNFAENNDPTLRPFGTGNWGSIFQRQWSAVSNYNALQALFRTRLKTVDAQFAYTWSKTLTNTDITDSSSSSNALNTYLDAFNHHLDYGPAQINRPHMLVGNIVYKVPTFTGQNGFVRTALGGWELSSILSYASGPSLTVLAGGTGAPGGILGTGFTSGERPNRVPGQSCRSQRGGQSWLNPAAFTLNNYVLGGNPTSPRGVCLGPGNAQTDLSVAKNFKITERVTAKFSLDFFNVFNKTQFIATAMNLNLSNSGVVCTAASPCPGHANDTIEWDPSQLQGDFGVNTAARDARQIQYGLKIDF
jgi:Carboxypeptidase regulatory-like domain/TonB-dependent Receptor Plug Domain